MGKIKGIPGVFSQGATLDELKENIEDAYRLMLESSEQKDEHPQSNCIKFGMDV